MNKELRTLLIAFNTKMSDVVTALLQKRITIQQAATIQESIVTEYANLIEKLTKQ